MGLFDFLKSTKNISNNNGLNEIYSDDGKGKIRNRHYKKNGKKDGTEIEFHENGQIKSHSIWEKGKQNGLELSYNSEGLLIRKSTLINDELGNVEEYYKNGSLRLMNFKENYSFFSKNNQKNCEIVFDYSLSKPKGIWINYNENEIINYKLNFEFDNCDKHSYDKVLKTTYNKSGNLLSTTIVTFKVKPYFYLNFYPYHFRERFDNIVEITAGYKGPPGAPGFSSKIIRLSHVLGIDNLIEIKEEIDLIEDNSKNKLTAVELFDRGTDKDSNRDYKSAIIDFTKAIEIDGEYIDAYRGRAMAKWSLRDYEGAIIDYTKILDLNSEDIDAFENRGHAKASLKDYEGAIEDFNKAIELDNESILYTSMGRAKMNILDFKGAMLDFNIAVEKYPEDDSSFFGRGELKYEIADYHGAIEDFNKCIEIKPNRIMSFHKRGDCKLKIEDYKGAIEDYSIVIQNGEDKYGVGGPLSENAVKLLISLYNNRAFARFKINDAVGWFEDENMVSELDPASKSKIEEIEKKSHLDENIQNPIQIEWIQTPESIYHDNGNSELQLDTLYTEDSLSIFLHTKTTKNAKVIIDKIINLNEGILNFKKEIRNGHELFYVGDKFSISWRYTIVGLIQVNIISRESIFFDEFNNINVKFDANHYNIAKENYLNQEAYQLNHEAYLNYDNGDYQEGIDSVKMALEIMPDDSGILDTLALGYYLIGDYKSAIEISNKCIEIDKNENSQNSEHFTTRAKIYLKLNNDENAIKDLKKAIDLDSEYEEAIQLLESLENN